MNYKLITGVWELTMECNMRCKHCGSGCAEKQEGELNTDEALRLCDELKTLEIQSVSLSGGEPTLRRDWPAIAKKLTDYGIQTNMITNAWLLDEPLVLEAKKASITTIAVSIDGLEETHDHIRLKNSFIKCIAALKLIKTHGILPSVITAVNKLNIDELEEMYLLLKDIGIDTWQLQIALPMGNFKQQTAFYLEPYHINQIIDFAHSKLPEQMKIVLGDNIGYYNKKILDIYQKISPDGAYWQGCTAGRYSIGILHNGDITGCTSMRDKQFIEGNIRERSLVDIWNSEDTFLWNRQFNKTSLKGLCAKCQYSLCRGGCSNARLCMNGDIYSENKYCSYHIEFTRVAEKIAGINDYDKLRKNAYVLASKGQFQSAELVLSKLIQLGYESIEDKELLAYVHFELGNFEMCEQINKEVLEVDPENAYASKGLGLALYKIGRTEDGLNHLYRAIDMKKGVNAEVYYDLFSVLLELKREDDAREVRDMAKSCSNYSVWQEKFDAALTEILAS